MAREGGLRDRAAQAKTGESLQWIVIAKGIGIVLVVIGHFHPEPSPDPWERFRDVIYSFHMPLFFVVSGFLYGHGKYSYPTLVRNKVRRLLYPFLCIAIGFLIIKLAMQQVVPLENPVDVPSVVAVVLDPVASYAPMLWFLQSLFLIFCLYAPTRWYLNDVAVLALGIAVNMLIGSRYPLVGRAIENLPFFAAGVLLRERPPLAARVLGHGGRQWALSGSVFALSVYAQLAWNLTYPKWYPLEWAMGMAGAIFVMNVSHVIAVGAGRVRNGLLRIGLLQIGYYSMTIYFFHSLFESAVRIGLMQVGGRVHVPFLWAAAAAVTAGVLGPIPLERGFIRKSPLARRLLLGLD